RMIDAQAGMLALKAAAEPTRLRILRLLEQGELTVKDLTHVLGQSQPRISRHLKLLHDGGMIERHREGSWVYFRLADGEGAGELGRLILSVIDGGDVVFRRDQERLAQLMEARVDAAQLFFEEHAAEWDSVRSLYVDEGTVEKEMRALLQGTLPEGGLEPRRRIGLLVDLGTGTGRVLALLGDLYERGLGVDTNQAMLAYARANLEQIEQKNAQVRHGDIHHLALDDGVADVVVMHQMLHFMTDPAAAIHEAARLLAPGGRLLVVDFAPHELEFLREKFAHQRLGFSEAQMRGWLAETRLELATHMHLAPMPDRENEKLTVSLWLAIRSADREKADAGGRTGDLSSQQGPGVTDASTTRMETAL
ncbi:MAG TPA: metalloregulator ArsR/SmtB family transcription factor, partial [Hyphomicrobiaceae bacterium]|nr:metalloregulator ArsR/SmtB family transcription factor [Hyphomicrobiaceae bacterium]